jgi:hypothetical protein
MSSILRGKSFYRYSTKWHMQGGLACSEILWDNYLPFTYKNDGSIFNNPKV